jgi:hypothetical protein
MDEISIILDDQVIAAALFFIEGELMNVIVKDPELFEVGQTIYFAVDEMRIQGKLIKKQGFNLYVFVSWTEAQLNNRRRKAARSPLNTEGTILYNNSEIQVRVLDVSIKGIAFQTELPLNQSLQYPIHFYVQDTLLHAVIKIQNEVQQNGKKRYGCTITSISEECLYHLRRFILMDQLNKL